MRLDNLVIVLFQSSNSVYDVVFPCHLQSAVLSHIDAQSVVGEQSAQIKSDGVAVSLGHQKTGLVVIDDLWNATMTRADHRLHSARSREDLDPVCRTVCHLWLQLNTFK